MSRLLLFLIFYPAGYTLTYMDEFVDQLLHEERVCDIILPRLAKREVLEDAGEVGPRKSRLLEVMEGVEEYKAIAKSPSPSSRSATNSPSPSHSHSPSRSPSRSRSQSRSLSRSLSHSRSPSRSRSPSASPIEEHAG